VEGLVALLTECPTLAAVATTDGSGGVTGLSTLLAQHGHVMLAFDLLRQQLTAGTSVPSDVLDVLAEALTAVEHPGERLRELLALGRQYGVVLSDKGSRSVAEGLAKSGRFALGCDLVNDAVAVASSMGRRFVETLLRAVGRVSHWEAAWSLYNAVLVRGPGDTPWSQQWWRERKKKLHFGCPVNGSLMVCLCALV
jgi:hypothetical protein